MKPFSNKIILISFKDGTVRSFAVPAKEKDLNAYQRILKLEELDKSDINKWFAFDRTLYAPEHYEKYWNVEEGSMDEISIVADLKMQDFLQQRGRIFPLLDMEFMKSLEEDCEECKKHVVRIKNHLRDLPPLLAKEFKELNDFEKISDFNPFNNIFDIYISDPGSGYEKPPRVLVAPPEGSFTGFKMKAVATINEEGTLDKVIVTQVGSAYREIPPIKVTKPEDPDGTTAILVASTPENDIIENVSWKETRMSDSTYNKNIQELLGKLNQG